MPGRFAIGGAAGKFADAGNALAWREGEAVRRAERFAEATFDAAVNDVFSRWHRFQVFEVGVRVVIKDNAGIKQLVGVEQRLDFAHQVSRVLAPFHFDKRCHVAPGAVFGLERAIIFFDNQLAEVIHETGVTVDFGGVAKILCNDKVQVTFEGVAENDRLVVTVMAEQGLQVERGVGKRFDVEGNILDQDRGAGAAHRANRGEGAFAYLPVHFAGRRISREYHWFNCGNPFHCSMDCGNSLI